MLVQFLLL